jgi:RimJ/RimL family protein N-acetyltransferase
VHTTLFTTTQSPDVLNHSRASGARTTVALRRLTHLDIAAFRDLRIASTAESPQAFITDAEQAARMTDAQIAALIEHPSGGCIWGAFAAADAASSPLSESLVGMVGLQRDSRDKLAHKGMVYAVYVAPTARRMGVGRHLMQAVMDYAQRRLQLRQLRLAVNAANTAALQLYQSMGFTAYGQEPDAIGINGQWYDEVLMHKRL